MKIVPQPMTVLDYHNAHRRGEVVVNPNYQRSDKVWPPMARSFLIETILLGYPVPKLSLHQVVDLRSQKATKEIVDGQQRSRAIWDFLEGKLRLSSLLETEDAAGRTFSELDDALRSQFLDYRLDFDLFTGATVDEVREVFRRMNSFTVPLNPEEQRHAVYQGKFKWFIHRLAREYDEPFLKMGVFSEKQVVRMADAKLLTELAHAYLYGITTTSKTSLERVYREKDRSFPEEQELGERIGGALDLLIAWSDLHNTSLMKPYALYSLVLALIHMKQAIPTLEPILESPNLKAFDETRVIPELTALAQALDNGETTGPMGEFVRASSERTNVAAQRATRFKWFARALNPP